MEFLVVIIIIVAILFFTGIKIVPQSRALVVERLGSYHRTIHNGPHYVIPIIERVTSTVTLKEIVKDFAPQPVITKDNVTMQIDTVVYYQITDLIKANLAKKILVINKSDVYDGDMKLATIDIKNKLSGVDFCDTIFISALKRKNINELLILIKKILPEGIPYYDSTDLTDLPIKKIVADMVRQQCLYKLDKEVPHSLVTIVDSMKTSKSKCVNIMATIVCDKESHKSIIIGKAGSMIKNIGTGARIKIEKFLGKKVNLKLNVIVRENWRDELTLLSNYGYDKNSI